MGQKDQDLEEINEVQQKRKLQIVYSRKTKERRIFFDDLKEYRKRKSKQLFDNTKESIGPKWYQVLSVPQRNALDTLERSIYQDLLEARSVRTGQIIKTLGIFPRPSDDDLFGCVFLGRDDPKEMLAQLFQLTCGHPFDIKRTSYVLNGRILLSSILYLGLTELLSLLKERFKPDKEPSLPPPKPKPPIEPPLESPYLQKMIAVPYYRPKQKLTKPLPLPNLDDLNEPYEEPFVPIPPPLPPPPPPPKKRLPRAYCDKLANFTKLELQTATDANNSSKCVKRGSLKKIRLSKLYPDEKKKYGISIGAPKKSVRRKKPKAPTTGQWNAQYTINGVYTIHGKSVFVIGNVSILPALGDLIHGGHRYVNDVCVNIHCGFRGKPPPPKPDPCDCCKKWQEPIFDFLKSSKCYCGHNYDYGNEGVFPADELPFFEKPKRNSPFKFNYDTIYNLDEKQAHIQKEFKAVWETDSVLCPEGAAIEEKKSKKKVLKRSSNTCLGQNPRPEDYLRCALRFMRRYNLAAKLPDIHLVPELKEWMRRRIYGPLTRRQKAALLRKSCEVWSMMYSLALKSYGHISPARDERFSGHTDWEQKSILNKKFRRFTEKYRLEMFRTQAMMGNLIWPSMCQAQLPDKKFREIYFSYMFARVEDLQLMHPYSTGEAVDRQIVIGKKRYCCPPVGAEFVET